MPLNGAADVIVPARDFGLRVEDGSASVSAGEAQFRPRSPGLAVRQGGRLRCRGRTRRDAADSGVVVVESAEGEAVAQMPAAAASAAAAAGLVRSHAVVSSHGAIAVLGAFRGSGPAAAASPVPVVGAFGDHDVRALRRG